MAIDLKKLQFMDIVEQEATAEEKVVADLAELKARKDKNARLSEIDTAELNRLQKLSDQIANERVYLDPLFASVRHAFDQSESGLQKLTIEHDAFGRLTVGGVGGGTDADVARVAFALGLLRRHDAPLPALVAVAVPPRPAGAGAPSGTSVSHATVEVIPDVRHRNLPLFGEALFCMVGRAGANADLAQRVLGHLAEIVDPNNTDGARVSSVEYAKIVERLIDAGVQPDEPKLKQHVEDSLDRLLVPDAEKPQHEIEIKLPDLEGITDYRVVKENIELMGPMIFASMFDELKAFQVVDRLIEMSQRNELSLTKGKAGTRLYNYWRQAPNRMSEMERQNFYAMTLGIPTGQPGVPVNIEFQDLWIRFVSSVSALVRENRVDQLLRSKLPVSINQQQIKKAARDLTSNMSLYGYGMAFYAAIDLQTQINEMIDLLGDPELRAAFGARDMWGVIDQVAQVDLGGARNSSKYRTLATCGAIITKWLATHTERLKDATLPMIDLHMVENPQPRQSGQTATSHPTDYDLVNACDLWLADSAMGDERIEELAQPRESPQQPSRPIQIPSIARDLLEGTGLGFGVSANGGQQRNGRFHGGRGAYRSF